MVIGVGQLSQAIASAADAEMPGRPQGLALCAKKDSVTVTFLVLFACLLLAGCKASSPISFTQSGLAGTYVYKSVDHSVDTPAKHVSGRLILRVDGTYQIVQGESPKAKSEVDGMWTIQPGDPPLVIMGNSGYPVQVRGHDVRLLINDDLGEWYLRVP